MAPEPQHLAGILKYCPSCGSADVKFVYNNNGKRDQPRYKCLVSKCSRFFTYGGKIRGSYGGGRRPRVPVKSPPSNRIGFAGDRSTRIRKPPAPAGVRSRVRSSLNVVRQSEPFEEDEILDEVAVGVVGGGAAIGGVAIGGVGPSEEKLDTAAGSSAGAALAEQRQASKTMQELAEAKVWVQAILGISPYGLVPAAQSKQLKRIRVKHQEWESVIQYFT